jgi:branched-chain amino acid transport system ATP-binding protein
LIVDPSRDTTLEITDVTLRFGGLSVLTNVSMTAAAGEITALIGPNGAGKSSLVNCVTGFYRPQQGSITLFGRETTGLSAHRVAGLGVARTFQHIELFQGLSVIDNLMLGRHRHLRCGALANGFFYGRSRREELKQRAFVEDIVDFLDMPHIRNTPVGLLPYGLQKRVDLGRALAQEPKLLILDEPMAGMNVEEKEDMARYILEIRQVRPISVILIEHDMGVVMDISDRVSVLDFGQFIAQGPPDEVRTDPNVIRAYMGTPASSPDQRAAQR